MVCVTIASGHVRASEFVSTLLRDRLYGDFWFLVFLRRHPDGSRRRKKKVQLKEGERRVEVLGRGCELSGEVSLHVRTSGREFEKDRSPASQEKVHERYKAFNSKIGSSDGECPT